jgi:hypothetical protein
MEDRLTYRKAVAFGTMREIHRHLDTEEAECYLMGESRDSEAWQQEEHLLICGRCRKRIVDTDLYLAAMYDAAIEIRAHPGKGVWRRRVVMGIGAGVILGLLALYCFRNLR